MTKHIKHSWPESQNLKIFSSVARKKVTVHQKARVAIISSRAKMVGRYDRQVCSRSLVVFNPLVNLPPSRDDGAISTYYLRQDPVPWLFLLWPLSNPAKPSHACSRLPHQPHPQHVKDQMAGFLKWVQGPFQVNHTRTTAKDQQRLRIYRTRNSEAIGLIINPNPSVVFNKQPWWKKDTFDRCSPPFLHVPTLSCLDLWQLVGRMRI